MLQLTKPVAEHKDLLNTILQEEIATQHQRYINTLNSLLDYSRKLDDYIRCADNKLKGRK